MIARNIASFLFVSLILCLQVQGQTIFSLFRSDLKKADASFKNMSYISALDLYQKVLHEKGESEFVNLQIARTYKKLNRPGESEMWYEKVIKSSSLVTSIDRHDYAEALLSNGKYLEAKAWYVEYLKDFPGDSLVFSKMQSLSALSIFYEDSLSYIVRKTNINSQASDFSPAFFGNGIVFLSSRKESEVIKKIDASTNDPFLDIYFAEILSKDSLSQPEKFKYKINTKFHEGPITFFSTDTKAIFTKNATNVIKGKNEEQSINKLELFYAEKDLEQNTWKDIKPLSINSAQYSTAHPTFSEQTNTLYFVSNRPGGFGGTDIYKSIFQNGRWGNPKNLGGEINTEGNEMFPFIYGGNTLCFASNGHPGLGGLDLFYTVLSDSSFGKPKNIGFPINTESDDFALSLAKNGMQGFFSSNRKGGLGADDIYSFSIQNVPLSGIVADRISLSGLDNVQLKLLEKDLDKETVITKSNGIFFFGLKPGRDYTLLVSFPGYKDKKIFLSTRGDSAIANLPTSILLERRTKAFVKGTIKDPSGVSVPFCKVRVLNRSAKELQVMTDDNGEFKCEVDADAENLFIAEKASMLGMERLKVEKMKKGSVVLNIEVELQPFRTYDVRGILKEEKSLIPLAGYEITVKNLVTKEEEELCTDQVGKFGFKVFTYASYDIVISFGKKKSNLKGFVPKQDHEFEIFWKDK